MVSVVASVADAVVAIARRAAQSNPDKPDIKHNQATCNTYTRASGGVGVVVVVLVLMLMVVVLFVEVAVLLMLVVLALSVLLLWGWCCLFLVLVVVVMLVVLSPVRLWWVSLSVVSLRV